VRPWKDEEKETQKIKSQKIGLRDIEGDRKGEGEIKGSLHPRLEGGKDAGYNVLSEKSDALNLMVPLKGRARGEENWIGKGSRHSPRGRMPRNQKGGGYRRRKKAQGEQVEKKKESSGGEAKESRLIFFLWGGRNLSENKLKCVPEKNQRAEKKNMSR